MTTPQLQPHPARAFICFARDLPNFFRTTLTLDQARDIVQRRLAEREDRFLQLVEHRIFGNPRSPYLPLLRMADCQLGDLRNMVMRSGLETTLRSLREAGVYFDFEEFKGRRPTVRNGQVLETQASDFDNPFLSAYYQVESGGSSGVATRVPISRYFLADEAPAVMLIRDAHGVLDVPTAVWRPILPASSGLSNVLRGVYLDRIPERWFSPGTIRGRGSSIAYRLATLGIVMMARSFGASVPRPEHVPLDQAITVARWAVQAVRRRGACLVRTFVSMALRVCIVAREQGLDLSGATFMGGGEPPTEAKVAAIRSSGANWIPNYSIQEVGRVAGACACPADGNDLHLLSDAVALIQQPQELPGPATTVNAFYFTTLLPTAPKVLLNVGLDDFGVIERRHCGCPLESLGYAEHVRHIRSFSKLTAEGMNVEGREMVRILEEVLPARFGGTPLDFQLLEEEEEQGYTRLTLLVSPRIEVDDEQAVLDALLRALAQRGHGEDLTQTIWQQAQTFRVKRSEPIWTARGKFLPLVRH